MEWKKGKMKEANEERESQGSSTSKPLTNAEKLDKFLKEN